LKREYNELSEDAILRGAEKEDYGEIASSRWEGREKQQSGHHADL